MTTTLRIYGAIAYSFSCLQLHI